MKILEGKDSLNSYIEQLRIAINSEAEAISIYDSMLNNSTISVAAKKILTEISDDEKDHLVILSELLNDEVEEQFPEYGDSEELEIAEEK